MSDAARRAEAGDAWRRFCRALERAGDTVLRGETPADELTLAEGYRHLVRMIRAGFESSCEFADPRHPRIVPMAERTLLYEGVTPDARYHHAFIDGEATYRVRGRRGTAPFIELSVYAGQTGLHPANDLLGSITERDLALEGDRFEVVLSPTEHAGNWIRTGPEARRLFIRQYAEDWSKTESASYAIEREDVAGAPPPLTLARLTEGLERTARFVATAPPFWAAISDYWKGHAVNRILPQEDADSRTDVTVPSGHRFACGYFRLAPDEALEIRFHPAEVPFWGMGLASYWYEPLHWPETRSSVNSGTATREPDGSVRVVVSDRRPEALNWLDSDGHREGTIVFRWSRTNEPLPGFATRVVAAADAE